MTNSWLRAGAPPKPRDLLRFGPVIGFVGLFVFFSLATSTFLSAANLRSVLVNHFSILGIASLGMTLVIAAGGIDLSIGTAMDMASLGFIEVLAVGGSTMAALATGVAAALAVGVVNAVLVARLRITPFLATLGTLFIGQSVEQLATGGGQPIYLVAGHPLAIFNAIGTGIVADVPVALWIAAGAIAGFFVLLGWTRLGRRVVVLGAGPGVARYTGLPVRRDTALVFIAAAGICGVAGIVSSATIRSYVPLAGNAYLLDAIGATFIGTTLGRDGRPRIAGTLLGVLLLSIVKNGLLLIGWTFEWQQVGTGILIFLVLAVSFGHRREA
ncbi:MAG: ABC transporter permease [Azospirillaceae bacterium]|nr:ABC transporter permease [Azospirillaceae bacterium]